MLCSVHGLAWSAGWRVALNKAANRVDHEEPCKANKVTIKLSLESPIALQIQAALSVEAGEFNLGHNHTPEIFISSSIILKFKKTEIIMK